jgi:hypothetical protein
MQAYEKKKQHLKNKTIDDESVYMCVSVTNSNYKR